MEVHIKIWRMNRILLRCCCCCCVGAEKEAIRVSAVAVAVAVVTERRGEEKKAEGVPCWTLLAYST